MPNVAKRRRRQLTAIDLFSGCGGLTLGLKWAGFKVLGAVDNDQVAVASYKANHPRVRLWESDIRALDASEVKRFLNLRKRQLDLLAGCPPCQGFSSLRTRNGALSVQDDRNDLIYEFLRFVRELRPKAVMMENVPGLRGDPRFERFCNALREMEYEVTFGVADAADYCVPQRRQRLILLASRRGKVAIPPKLRRWRHVRHAIRNLPKPGDSGDALHDLAEERSGRIVDLIRRIPHDGGGRMALGADQLKCHTRTNGFKDIYGRMAWNSVSPTITSGCTNPSKGRFLHPDQDRAITLREAALLQGFPRKYAISLGRGKSGAAKVIGNALPPNFGKWQAFALRKCLQRR